MHASTVCCLLVVMLIHSANEKDITLRARKGYYTPRTKGKTFRKNRFNEHIRFDQI